VVAIVHAALVCLRQRDLKRLIAYSSVGHMGFVVLGVATLTEVGLAAAVYASVAHGVVTGLLFFLSGALKDRHGTGNLDRLGGGMYARTPWLAVAFAFSCLASLGLPGLAGFWGSCLRCGAHTRPGSTVQCCRGGSRGRCSDSPESASR
jgi:NADH-quinone oxidoreductase subunit M